MGKWLKIAFLAALLIGSGYFFGTVCKQASQVSALLVPPSPTLLALLGWLALALGGMAVAGGLIVALVRPAWVGIIAFALAGLAMLLGWQVTVGSGALALVYLLAASLYNVDVGRELNQRIQFSVRPVGRGQGVLLIALVLVFCGSLCLGYAAYIEREGFSIPESSIEFLMEQWERQFLSSVPEEQRQAPEFETRLAALREDFRRQVDELFARLVEPYKQFIPLIVAAGLFIPLVIATWLLAWVPTIVLSTVLVLLRATGVIRVVRETQEVQRLVM